MSIVVIVLALWMLVIGGRLVYLTIEELRTEFKARVEKWEGHG